MSTELTKWGKRVNRAKPLGEYPRPQMYRRTWASLNGMWEYQTVTGDRPVKEAHWRKICVPFALGTPLSGTNFILQPGETLWYRRTFAARPGVHRTILHFEAVDQCCEVYLNGFKVGAHAGGYTPFSMDVSSYIKYQNALMVRVWDDSDTGIYAYGKQRLQHGGIWYTPTSGIWGSVWIEAVPERAVENITIVPDYDRREAYIELTGNVGQAKITVTARDGSFAHTGITAVNHYTVPMGDFRAWSPEDPFLYDVDVLTEDDHITSYFGMRKFSRAKDTHGHMRFFLNNQPYFLSGVLDQGINPDGFYTYPSEEEMVFELKTVKAMGFNMIRKHVKVESRRWYALCDELGLLVMQDMPNGGGAFQPWSMSAAPMVFGMRRMDDRDPAKFGRESEASRKAYYRELGEMIEELRNCVSVFAWVPFNEGWGQFDACRAVQLIHERDVHRLVDGASGWHDQGCGDFQSIHCYFRHFHMPEEDERITILSEFGGYAYVSSAHSRQGKKKFGYKFFSDRVKLDRAVNALYEKDIFPHIDQGLSGCVYTQLTDVEEEVNGLLTADREAVKIDAAKMKKMNMKMRGKMKYAG